MRWITGSRSRAARLPRGPSRAHPERSRVIRIAELLDPTEPEPTSGRCSQVGVDDVVSLLDDGEQAFRWLRSEESHPTIARCSVARGRRAQLEPPALERLKARYEEAGFELVAIEDTPPMDRVRLGLPGREEQLDAFCEQLRAMGAVGVPTLCYNWVAGLQLGPHGARRARARRRADDRVRPRRDEPRAAAARGGRSRPRSALWENFEYFLRRVVPVAEEAGVSLALHPDDPPISPVRGLGRIMRSVDAFRARGRARPERGQRHHDVPGQLRADDRRPARRDPRVRRRGHDPLRALPRRARHAVALRRDVPRPRPDRHARVPARVRRRRLRGRAPTRPRADAVTASRTTSPGTPFLGRLFAVGYIRGLSEAVSGRAPA